MAKSLCLAYFIWALFGVFGGHRFYLGHTSTGFLFLFPGGVCFVGWLSDIVRIRELYEEVRLRCSSG